MVTKSAVELIEKYCLGTDLSSYDPYDLWMTPLGIKVKALFNRNKMLGIVPAALLTIWDQFLNNGTRFFYSKQEYPTARATAALTLLALYSKTKKSSYLEYAKLHLDWLLDHSCIGYAGLCWGLGFKWEAGDDLDYDENTPFSTHTPYVLEAIHQYIQLSGNKEYELYVHSIYKFYEQDIKIIYEDEQQIATSYGPSVDRLVTNAVSYTMYAYAIFSVYLPSDKLKIQSKVNKLYNFIKSKQLEDGSWLYSPEDPDSFIDCFHSCFVLKNLFKTNKIIPLQGLGPVMDTGYGYVKENFLDANSGLYKRFTKKNKPSVTKFDLYDNAEMLHLSVLLGDFEKATQLNKAIANRFIKKESIFSVIDLLNTRRNKNTYRWASMPYLYAVGAYSCVHNKE